MKIRLLNDGRYSGLEEVQFPAEVEATVGTGGRYEVHEDELARIGADMGLFSDPGDPVWPFAACDIEVLS